MRIPGLSAVVICYNRIDVVEACLVGARYAEELIVVDKSSTDGTDAVAREYADKFYSVPWSPTVEETRAFAVSKASNDWVLLLDDDECINIEALEFVRSYILSPKASVCGLPQKHYVLGRHDPDAYYWPEHQVRLFRRDAVEFSGRVHGGFRFLTEDRYWVPHDSGPALRHLSHPDAHAWIEKTNRYTSSADRSSECIAADVTSDGFRAILEKWLAKVPQGRETPYLAAVATLRAIYDMVDAIKIWEATQDDVGRQSFIVEAERIIAEHRKWQSVNMPASDASSRDL